MPAITIDPPDDDVTSGRTGSLLLAVSRLPRGNKSQLDMLGDGDIIATSWDNSVAPVVRDILVINEAFAQISRTFLTDIYIQTPVFGHILVNSEVQHTGGVEEYRVDEFGDMTMRLKGCPWIAVHACNRQRVDGFAIGADCALFACKDTRWTPSTMAYGTVIF